MSTTTLIGKFFTSRPQTKTAPLEERLVRIAKAIGEAEAILVGAGAGLSTAAGLSYDDEDFRREFRPWIEKYGITDLYSSSFYPWASEEERWAYWAKHIYHARFRPIAMPLYRALLALVREKGYFVITTNVDGQFEKAGFDKRRIFATQGDYAYLQSATGEPRKRYYNEEIVREMLENIEECRIPPNLVPHCPENGELMTPNLRVDNTFVEDELWHQQADAYFDFISSSKSKKLVLLEFGVGFNTPSIIRYPFEQMARELTHSTLIRFNKNESFSTLNGLRDFIPVPESLDVDLIERLALRVNSQTMISLDTTSSR